MTSINGWRAAATVGLHAARARSIASSCGRCRGETARDCRRTQNEQGALWICCMSRPSLQQRMRLSRRTFLRSSAGAAALLGFPAMLRSANPNSALQVAVVGANGQGLSDLTETGSHSKVRLIAFCDVDTSRIEKAAAKFPTASHFQNFREMF